MADETTRSDGAQGERGGRGAGGAAPASGASPAPPAARGASAWTPLLEELSRRRRAARAMGGEERLERLVRARGKIDARARLAALFDGGRMTELGPLAGGERAPADAFVAGFGRVEGRPVLAGAEDFSVLGGSIGAAAMAKRTRLAELALRERVPLVVMLDGAGHRLQERHPPGRTPNDLLALADLAGRVPVVCLVLGYSAGHGALAAPLSDFTVMTRGAALFSGGPPLVRAATGEEVTPAELGGAEVCETVSGLAHRVVDDDREAIALARRWLGYLPSRRGEAPPREEGPRTAPREVPELPELIPPDGRRPYSMRRVLAHLVDEGSLLEVHPRFGAALVTALARIGGRAVAMVANDPAVRAGAIDRDAALKGEEFIERMGAFGLPFVFLADNPGVMAGTRAEREGILRFAGRMFRAQRRLAVPKIHVTVRKAFGFGSSVMAQNPWDRQSLSLALPTATLGAMPAGPGGRAAGLDAGEQARVEALEASGPWRIAEGFGYDDVVAPQELRSALVEALAWLPERVDREPEPGGLPW